MRCVSTSYALVCVAHPKQKSTVWVQQMATSEPQTECGRHKIAQSVSEGVAGMRIKVKTKELRANSRIIPHKTCRSRETWWDRTAVKAGETKPRASFGKVTFWG